MSTGSVLLGFLLLTALTAFNALLIIKGKLETIISSTALTPIFFILATSATGLLMLIANSLIVMLRPSCFFRLFSLSNKSSHSLAFLKASG